MQLENAAELEQQVSIEAGKSLGSLEGVLQTVNSKVHQLAEAGKNLSQQLQKQSCSVPESLEHNQSEAESEQHLDGGVVSKGRILLTKFQEAAAGLGAGMSGQHQGFLGKTAGVAAAVAGGLLAVATLQSYFSSGRASTDVVPARQAATPAAASQPAAGRLMSSGAAWRLIQQFQKAKARALGSEFDCRQLSSVLMGQALQHYQNMAHDSAARGWFRTSRLWKCEVQR